MSISDAISALKQGRLENDGVDIVLVQRTQVLDLNELRRVSSTR